MSEDEMEAEYVRLLKLARHRKEAGILSPDDYKAEKSRLSDMREGWIRRRVFDVSPILSPDSR